MRQFIKYTFASAIGFFISMVLVITVGLIFVFTTISTLKKEFKEGLRTAQKKTISDNSVLQLEFDYPISERTRYKFQYGKYQIKRNLGLNDILQTLEHARQDDKIEGVYLDLNNYKGSMTITQEIREALKKFRQDTTKFVYAYGNDLSQNAYHLASVADKIYLHPNGYLFFKGLSAEVMFFKNTLKRLKIEPQIFKSGKYKGAIEPLYRDEMSEPNRHQTQVFLNTMFDNMKERIAAQRPIGATVLDSIADSLLVRTPSAAKQYNLVDELYYKDEFLAHVHSKLNIADNQEVNFVDLEDYSKSVEETKTNTQQKIAIVYGSGAIQQGSSSEKGIITEERMSDAIKEARKDTSIKAIVLRINSPGGSALASDVIWRQVVLARQEKPVIASMSDVAASGGYYISCAADTIVAHSNTITGSIGVFGFLPNAQSFFNKKLGISFDRVKTNPYSDFMTISRPLSNKEKKVMQDEIDRIYDQFVSRVAKGRGLSKDSVHTIAQGRVWTGEDAKAVGLVDVLGGRKRAIAMAADKAQLDDYSIENYPEQKDPFQEIMDKLTGDMQSYVMSWYFGEQSPRLQKIRSLMHMQGIQARMPYSYLIR